MARFLCIPVTYAVSQYKLNWFFPAMLLLMGGRYLTYRTIFGLGLYWSMGGVLALAAYLLAAADAVPWVGAFAVARVELLSAASLFVREMRSSEFADPGSS